MMWGDISMTLTQYTSAVTAVSNMDSLAVDHQAMVFNEQHGVNFEQKLSYVLNSLNS